MESRSQIFMIDNIEEKYKFKVDVGVGGWRWSFSFSFITLVRCAIRILSVKEEDREIHFLIHEEKSKQGALGKYRHVASVYLKC